MAIRISRIIVDALIAEAARTPDQEVCGLLFGDDDAVDAFTPCRNVADDPATRFEIDPAALIAAYKAERAGGARLIGHYHSHPGGVCAPSAADAAAALDVGRYWLIVAGGRTGMWRVMVPGRFVECGVDVAERGGFADLKGVRLHGFWCRKLSS